MKKIIIDCDPGIDDFIAIVLALKSPELKVVGITIASGNVPAEICATNALRAIEMAGTYRPPVYVGSGKPLVRAYVSAAEVHGSDGMGGANLPYSGSYEAEGGVDFILETLNENPGQVSICAIGPLTNLALCMEKDPTAFSKAKEIVLMGGASRTHGNISPVAEFNFFCDPHAAERVFKCGLPIVMVGLDATYQLILTPGARELFRQWDTESSRAFHKITRFYLDFHWEKERTLGCVINDPLAVAYLIDERVFTAHDAFVDIVTEGKAVGQSMTDFKLVWGEANARVAMEVDVRLALELIYERIFPDKKDDIKLLLDLECR